LAIHGLHNTNPEIDWETEKWHDKMSMRCMYQKEGRKEIKKRKRGVGEEKKSEDTKAMIEEIDAEC